MNWATSLLPLLWAATSLSYVPDEDTYWTVAQVTVSMTREFGSSCIQLFHSDELGDRDVHTVYRLWKELSVPETRTTTGIHSFRRYVTRKLASTWKVSCYRPLKVFLSSNGTRSAYALLTHQLLLKDSVWIVFTDEYADDFFSDANLLFDNLVFVAVVRSRDLAILYEVYKVGMDYPLRINYYGRWSSKMGLEVSKVGLYKRRYDLEGLALKTAAIKNWPNTYVKNNQWRGLFIEVWSAVAQLTNSSFSIFETVEGVTGILQKDGSWSGLVGMVLRGDIDFILSELTLEKTRTRVLDFFHPQIHARYFFYYKQRGYALQWSSVFKPFELKIWIAIILWILLGTVSVAVCFRMGSTYGFAKEGQSMDPSRSFLFMLQTLCQQSCPKIPRSASCRILFLVSYMISSMLIRSYSASLVTYLRLRVPFRPFGTLEELYEKGEYRLLIRKSSGAYSYFANDNDQIIQDIFRDLVLTVPPEHEVIDRGHALRLLCQHQGYAFLDVDIIMKVRLRRIHIPRCHVSFSSFSLIPVFVGMGSRKNWPYSGLINYHLTGMRVTGVTNRILDSEFPRYIEPDVDPQLSVSLVELFPVFAFVALSVVASLAILLIEREYYKRKSRRRNLFGKRSKHLVGNVLWPIKYDHLSKKHKFHLRPQHGYLN